MRYPAAPMQGSGQPVKRSEARALFLSDLHLGAPACRAEAILAVLHRHPAATIYLVGDVFDTWHPFDRPWPAAQRRVLMHLLDLARAGTPIVYVPGNHDCIFRDLAGRMLSGVSVQTEAWHVTADGARLLVTHGDAEDILAHRLPAFARVGALVEALVRLAGAALNMAAGAVGAGPWDAADQVIRAVNRRMRAMDAFERRLSRLAIARGADGVVCGHFHQPALHRDHGTLYANCGDFVEHCTALVEHHDGRLELVAAETAPAPLPVARGAMPEAVA
jgi:UDP-2,3-diacylglucosamine pyrophosphatase LpxH